MMLFSMLSAAQGGKSIVFLSRHFGLSNRQMTNVIRHYLPILMRGIQKNFAQQGGLSSLLKTLHKGNYGSYYDDPNIYTDPEVRSRGMMIMERALGGDEIQRKVLHRIYLSTGIDPDTLQLILPYVTTLALSTLYRKAHTQLNPSAMPSQLPYHGPNGGQEGIQQPQLHLQKNQHQNGHQHIPGSTQQFAHQNGQGSVPGMQQQTTMPINNPEAYSQPAQGYAQQQNFAPRPQAQAQERLPNIILQAQEAHAQKQRKINKKGRLSRMLKAPFQSQNALPPQEQPQPQPQLQQQHGHYQGQYAAAAPQQPQQYYPQEQQHYNQLQPANPHMHHQQQDGPGRKYVSLQEKLSAQLPWYEQTG